MPPKTIDPDEPASLEPVFDGRESESFASCHVGVVMHEFLRDVVGERDGCRLTLRVASHAPVREYLMDWAIDVLRDGDFYCTIGVCEHELQVRQPNYQHRLVGCGVHIDEETAHNGYRVLLAIGCTSSHLSLGWLAAYPGDKGTSRARLAMPVGSEFATQTQRIDGAAAIRRNRSRPNGANSPRWRRCSTF